VSIDQSLVTAKKTVLQTSSYQVSTHWVSGEFEQATGEFAEANTLDTSGVLYGWGLDSDPRSTYVAHVGLRYGKVFTLGSTV